jgi:acetyl-CoA/propionyl-CoA carboxylase, biotin carboxylase, biotin carboxyl carrier protein
MVPGTQGSIGSAKQVSLFGEEHGFPVAVKASSGGGGKGFAVAGDASEAASAFERASREGEAYFGDGSVYVEKYLSAPRHVELQVVRDRHRNAVHLGERDCSIQRRHQKLIEECPSPAIDPKMREAMGEAALAAAEAVDYDNVGTVEFLVEKGEATGEFYFLEMNTRVQVEHPVTEEVTGIDIVKTGIRIAAGEELPYLQRDISWRGHAIEVRLNAEDASNDFSPSPGVVTAYEEPGGPGVRVDSSLRGPGVVAESYDPLFAKLIVSGVDREEALARLGRAVAEFRVEGISTTLPFYRAILDDEAFVSGDYTTGFIAERMQSLKIQPATTGTTGEASEKRAREVEVEVNGKLFRVRVFGEEDASGGPPRRRRGETRRASASGGAVQAPMQGTIVKVLVEEGQEVAADEPVCILEAMKMESEVRSQKAGTVSEVRVEAGQTVRSGETLISVE